MTAYIDKELLLKDISESVVFTVRRGAPSPAPELRGARKIVDRIESAPTADVAEVKYGYWKTVYSTNGYHKECSECGARWMLDSKEYMCKETPYCPHCGAKMDGKPQKEGAE